MLTIPFKSSEELGTNDERRISAVSLYLTAEEDTGFPTSVNLGSPDPSVDSVLPTANLSFDLSPVPEVPLCRLPLRSSSSPLRPSQWVASGGSLSISRRRLNTPDRFIPPRQPPNSFRQNFDLANPDQRLAFEDRHTPHSIDPFSRHLRRTSRMNEELRSLREAHAMLTSRMMINRQRTDTRVRQISGGAVWNVGGSSAASDTVLAVSNGNGGLLGSGTNAPLYTSMFLSRSDPDAEREAYERRIALALNIGQVNRILDYSRLTSTPASTRQSGHIWKDSAWTRDGVSKRASIYISLGSTKSMLTDLRLRSTM